MTLDKIHDEWKADQFIDKTELLDMSVQVPSLHHKYATMLSTEVLSLTKIKTEYNKFFLDKWEWYTTGPFKEGVEKGWKLPAGGKIMKNEVEKYILADTDIISISLKVSYHQEKVDFLKLVMESIRNRHWNIQSAIKYEIFQAGG